jgi:hypothetical protein
MDPTEAGSGCDPRDGNARAYRKKSPVRYVENLQSSKTEELTEPYGDFLYHSTNLLRALALWEFLFFSIIVISANVF